PFLLRRHGDTYVLMLIAHDEHSGTKAPILDLGKTRAQNVFQFFPELQEDGYRFVPTGDRVARVRLQGLPNRAQRWDPRTGRRTELEVSLDSTLEVPFEDGPISLVVLGEDLPAPTREAPGEVVEIAPVQGPWRGLAESHGDFPIEVWRLAHSDGGDWRSAKAGYGPFAEVRDPDGDWRATEWSLSRGIDKDPLYLDNIPHIAPKGLVLEEFLDWRYL